MTQTLPIRLRPDEIDRQARKFFGSGKVGLELTVDELHRLRFEGRHGFIEFAIRPTSNNQVRLTIQHQGYESELQAFRQLLARQAAAETSTGG